MICPFLERSANLAVAGATESLLFCPQYLVDWRWRVSFKQALGLEIGPELRRHFLR